MVQPAADGCRETADVVGPSEGEDQPSGLGEACDGVRVAGGFEDEGDLADTVHFYLRDTRKVHHI